MKENQVRAYENRVYTLIYKHTFKIKNTSPPT